MGIYSPYIRFRVQGFGLVGNMGMCYLGIASPDFLPTTRKFGSGAWGLWGWGICGSVV